MNGVGRRQYRAFYVENVAWLIGTLINLSLGVDLTIANAVIFASICYTAWCVWPRDEEKP